MNVSEDESDAALSRMFKKGGRCHFSLRDGSVIHPHGEKPLRISEGMTDEEWDKHLASIGVGPKVIYL